MQLEEYLKEKDMHPMMFAVNLNVSVASVYGWLSKRHLPGPNMAKRIEKLTDGAVPAKIWKK